MQICFFYDKGGLKIKGQQYTKWNFGTKIAWSYNKDGVRIKGCIRPTTAMSFLNEGDMHVL